MANENLTRMEKDSLFIDGYVLLHGAKDLLLSYADEANAAEGGKMNRVHAILNEASEKFDAYSKVQKD